MDTDDGETRAEFDGDITISFNGLPAIFIGEDSDLHIYHFAEDLTSAEEPGFTEDDSTISFEADHVSAVLFVVYSYTEDAVELKKTVGGVDITVSAEAGVLPEGTYMEVTEITDEDTISELVETAAGESDIENDDSTEDSTPKAIAFDIKLYIDDDGEKTEVEFDDLVTVSFAGLPDEFTEDEAAVSVYHFDEAEESAEEVEFLTDVNEGEISFEVEHFSTFLIYVAVVESSSDGNVILQDESGNTSAYNSITEALNSLSDESSPDVAITLNADITEDVVIPEGYTVTLHLNGQTLTGSGESTVIYVSEGASLTVNDEGEDGTIKGGNGAPVYSSVSKSILYYGGNIYSLGDLTINGGTISEGYAAKYGGGIYINDAELTINGGEISDNSATMAGGIYALNAEVIINGGTISGNSSDTDGGGIYASKSDVTITGGEITENEAPDEGGGIYFGTAEFNMSGGTISGNTAKTGGGIKMTTSSSGSAVCTFTGGTITGNTASSGGGGIYINNGSRLTFTMSDGVTVSNNDAVYGGGIYASCGGSSLSGSMELTGGEIIDNVASEDGGGIYISNSFRSIMTIAGTSITSNEASGSGGGIYISNTASGTNRKCEITINDVEISENSAEDGGGIYLTDTKGIAVVYLNDGSISSNTASGTGGGFYLDTGSLEAAGGVLANNTADTAASDLYISSSATSISGLDAVNSSVTYEADDYGLDVDGWYCDESGARYADLYETSSIEPADTIEVGTEYSLIAAHDIYDLSGDTCNVNGHSYSAVWTWTKGDDDTYTEATAVLTCSVCKDEQTITATTTEANTDNTSAVIDVTTNEPTCEENGATVYTATVTYTDSNNETWTFTDAQEIKIAATGHDWDYSSGTWTVKRASWTSAAERSFGGTFEVTCKNDSSHTVTYNSTGFMYFNTYTEPTCTEEGKYKFGLYYGIDSDGNPEHISYEEGTIQSNVESVICGDDGYFYYIIPALGHSYEAEVTEPTCTEGGYTTYTCTVCGDSYVDDYTDATGHSWDEGTVTTEATCTEDGVRTYTCSVCGDTYTEAIAATGHSYEEVVTDPTCTEGGYTTYTCSVCGDSYVDDYTDAAGHSWDEGTVTTEATCTEDGVRTYTCSVCGDTYTEAIAATGHSYDEVVTDPTCTEGGYTTYTCSVCGDSYVDDYTDATGHSYEAEVTDPTCTEGGYTTYTCTVCGDSYVDGYTDAAGHSYDAEVTDPTCTEGGYTTYTCTVCGDSYVDDYTDATGHSWDEGTVTTEATCTEDGVRTYTCSVCGDTYTEAIAAIGHSYDAEVTDPTCTEGGYTTYICSVCGDSYTDDETEALGHDYDYENGEWSWSDDYSTASYIVACSNGSHTETYEASISSDTDYDSGITTYTAVVSVNGTTYTDTMEEAADIGTDSSGTDAGNADTDDSDEEDNSSEDSDQDQSSESSSPIDASEAVISTVSSRTYTGSTITPDVTVTLNGIILVKGTDYTVSYSNNVDVGTATILITFIGNYTGTASTTFRIVRKSSSSSGSSSSGSGSSGGSTTSTGSINTVTGEVVSYGDITAYNAPTESGAVSSGTWIDATGTGDKWMYSDADGNYVKDGWVYISNSYTEDTGSSAWFHFDSEGIMTTGWYKASDTDWYYFSENNDSLGILVTGWYTDEKDGHTYYFDPVTGLMYSGYNMIDGKLYYFASLSDVPQQTWFLDTSLGKWIARLLGVRTYGSLYKEEETPDGKTAGFDGAIS